MRIPHLLYMSACLLIAASAFAQKAGVESLVGTWTGEWWPHSTYDFVEPSSDGWDPSLFDRLERAVPNRYKVTVEVKRDSNVLTAIVNSDPKAVELQMGTFDAKTSTFHFEADAKDESGRPIHCVIEGKVKKDTFTGNWSHEYSTGNFKIKKKK